MSTFDWVLLVFAIVIVLPVALLILSALWMAASTKRTMQDLARRACPVCLKPLGKTAVQKALVREIAQRGERSEFGESLATASVDIAGHWTLHCARCGTELVYDFEQRTWLKVQLPHEL
jgi:hypothetical protein